MTASDINDTNGNPPPSQQQQSSSSSDDRKKKNDAKKQAKMEKFLAKQAKQQAKASEKKSTTDAASTSHAAAPVKQSASNDDLYIDNTPFGQKKDLSGPMPSSYQPAGVEAVWYPWWEAQGFFKPKLSADGNTLPAGTFVIPIPPPNVTGSLHLGHALTNTIQDVLTRWHRMRGFTTLWNPGCDHAGIATQAVVEKKIWKESKLTRHDMGREKFIEKVWVWKNEYGDRIYNQIKRLGSSVDWEKACFTMDPKFVVAVTEAFVRLHDEGIIYRDTRLVNWSCKLNTALSNLEVENKELSGRTLMSVPGHDPNRKYEFGVIISFAYPIENSDEKIIVATTRIETMLGDTAVAVHPEDPRYKHLVGKMLVHPFNGRRIPIIADTMVDREFGSGAVKITPAHDPNDYQVGKRHGLEFINILNDNGTINANGAPFEGLMRFDARVEVLKALKEKGLYIETKDNKMVIPICSRSGDVIEPLLKPQWWVNCTQMAHDAMKAVNDSELNIIPKLSEKEWFKWLENIQDWCISRQLWWGHSIPAYFVTWKGHANDPNDGHFWVSGRTRDEAFAKACERFKDIPKEKLTLVQDPDVLDTWFSSALWPFAIFGWPEKTPDLEHFYPNSLLETGWDILFFWVARMVMMGIKLTGKVPFKEVFCHAMVRDAHGRKMSKSLGNVIDPLDVINGISLDALQQQLEMGNLDPREIAKAKEGQRRDFPKGIPECGADALRFTLAAYTSAGRDINLDILRVDGYRKFCNKLWNATRFALMKLGSDFVPAPEFKVTGKESLCEKWILHRANQAASDLNAALKDYNFMNATTAVHKFWLYELCDVYIEVIKPVTDSTDTDAVAVAKKKSAQETLYSCLDYGLKMLHPFMPFVTEELYQRLPRRPNDTVPSICITKFPEADEKLLFPEDEKKFDFVMAVVRGARSMMSDYGITNNATVYTTTTLPEYRSLLNDQKLAIETLITTKKVTFSVLNENESVPPGCALTTINESCNVYLMVRGMVDIDAEVEKLRGKMGKTVTARDALKERMSVPDYEAKVREDVRAANDTKMTAYEAEIEAINKGIENFLRLK